MKKNLLLLFFILSGAIAGGLVAHLCQGVPVLKWLAYGKSVGIDTANPLVLDLAVLKIAFGFSLSVNIAQILFIILAILLYKTMGKKL